VRTSLLNGLATSKQQMTTIISSTVNPACSPAIASLQMVVSNDFFRTIPLPFLPRIARTHSPVCDSNHIASSLAAIKARLWVGARASEADFYAIVFCPETVAPTTGKATRLDCNSSIRECTRFLWMLSIASSQDLLATACWSSRRALLLCRGY